MQKRHPLRTVCRTRTELAKQILSGLQHNSELAPILGKAHRNAELSSCISDSNNFSDDFGKLTLALNQTTQCTRLKAGEKSLVDLNGPQMDGSPTGTRGKYQLARLQDKDGKPQYQITIRPRFRGPNQATDPAIQQHYEQETQNCFNQYKDDFKGANGENLIFEISSPKNSSGFKSIEESPTAFIRIEDSLERANSAQWNANIDCPTKIHEIMHTLGLVDEYQESSTGVLIDAEGNPTRVKKDATLAEGDCRVIGPKDSLMHNQWTAIKSLSPSREATFCICESAAISEDILEGCSICAFGSYEQPGEIPPMGFRMGMPAGTTVSGGMMGAYVSEGGGIGTPPKVIPENEKAMYAQMEEAKKQYEKEMAEYKTKCIARLNSIVAGANSCPAGTNLKTQAIKMSDLSSSPEKRKWFDKLAANEIDEAMLTRGLEVRTIPGRTSLLYPAQFRALVAPGCLAENRTYYQCAKESKRTSHAVYGKDRCSTLLPPECRKGGSAWLQ